MSTLTTAQARLLRARAQRLETQVADLMHRVTIDDPYGRHPDTGFWLASLARDGAIANGIVRNLTAYLEAHP